MRRQSSFIVRVSTWVSVWRVYLNLAFVLIKIFSNINVQPNYELYLTKVTTVNPIQFLMFEVIVWLCIEFSLSLHNSISYIHFHTAPMPCVRSTRGYCLLPVYDFSREISVDQWYFCVSFILNRSISSFTVVLLFANQTNTSVIITLYLGCCEVYRRLSIRGIKLFNSVLFLLFRF